MFFSNLPPFLPSLLALSGVSCVRPALVRPQFSSRIGRAASFFSRAATTEHRRKMTDKNQDFVNIRESVAKSRQHATAIPVNFVLPFVCVQRPKEWQLVQVGRHPRAFFF